MVSLFFDSGDEFGKWIWLVQYASLLPFVWQQHCTVPLLWPSAGMAPQPIAIPQWSNASKTATLWAQYCSTSCYNSLISSNLRQKSEFCLLGIRCRSLIRVLASEAYFFNLQSHILVAKLLFAIRKRRK